MDRRLETVDDIKRLAERLQEHPMISRYDTAEEPGGWLVANALAHIEESTVKFAERLAELLSATGREAQDDVIVEITEDLRHIVYHIRDSQLFENALM